MEKSLQKRLVGAVVLVALGVIFIPALLDGSGYKSRHIRTVEIPPKPEFIKYNAISKQAPLSKDLKLAAKPIVDKPLASPLEIRKKAIKLKKVAKPPAQIQSWALQIGTFSQKSNAIAFRDKQRKAGLKAYVEPGTSEGKTSYRVRIGPELEKSHIEKLKKRLKKEQSIDGFIVNHP